MNSLLTMLSLPICRMGSFIMSKLSLFIILLLTTVFARAHASENNYLCVADIATGFHYENNKWSQASFDIKGEKYILRKLKDEELEISKNSTYKYGFVELGSNRAWDYCTHNGEIFDCIGPGFITRINTEKGRYLRIYVVGYTDGDDNNTNTPHMEIGRCSKL